MEEKLEEYYKKWQEIISLINKSGKEQGEIYNRLIETELGKFYFSLTGEQKESFKRIYSSINNKDYYNSDFYKYCNLKDTIEAYHKMLLDQEIEALYNADFPFKKRELAIYIKDGVDTYNALTDESTKDLKVSDKVKLFIQSVINDLYVFNDNFTKDDIPLIRVIYNNLIESNITDINVIKDIIINAVNKIHALDKGNITYRENRIPFIKKLKNSLIDSESDIRNSASGFKYLLLFLVETAKYEVSLLEGKRVTTLLKEIEESNMSECDKDYFKDALVKAYYNLTNINFRRESEYFDNDHDICYASFETANPEINKRLIKMRQW